MRLILQISGISLITDEYKGHNVNWKIVKLILALSILSCVVVFVSNTDMDEVRSQIESVGFGFLLILLVSGASLFMGSVSWKFCFSNKNKISVWRLFLVRTIGEMITIVNPTNIVAGEATKIHLLHNSKISKKERIDSILISRLILIATQLILTVLCVAWLAQSQGWLLQLVITIVLIAIFGWSSSLLILKTTTFPGQRADTKMFRLIRYCRLNFYGFRKRLFAFYKKNRRDMMISSLFSAGHYILGASELLIIFHCLDLNANIIDAITVDMGVVIIKSLGGFVPAQIGVEEFGNKYMLSITGIKAAGVWVSVSILRRAKQIFWIIAAGVFYTFLKIQSKKYKPVEYGHPVCHT